MNKEIYLDCAASSPMLPEVLEYMVNLYKKQLGNPASIHRSGVAASLEVEKARVVISSLINCSPEEIYFTSGATEANNLALKGYYYSNSTDIKNELIISSIEHSSIIETAKELEKIGCKINYVKVQPDGVVDLEHLKNLISDRTLIVSIAHANSEIGVIQDLNLIGDICQKKNILFHSDGAQAFCKTPVDVIKMNLSCYSLSSHKIHGPKGTGAIFIKSNTTLSPQLVGGGQESGIRSGTVPAELIATFAFATSLFTEDSLKQTALIQRFLLEKLQSNFNNIKFNGSLNNRLKNQINFSISGINGKAIMQNLDKNNIRISLGSACHSSKKTPSHVLKAIGRSDEESFEAVRVSWGLNTTIAEIEEFVKFLILSTK